MGADTKTRRSEVGVSDQVWAGEMLALFRRLAGKGQGEAGAVVGRKAAAIGHWESGRSLPSIPQLYKLAALYGVPAETLIDAMNYEGTKIAPAIRDWFRETHGTRATAGVGTHAPRSAGHHSGDSSADSPTTPTSKQRFPWLPMMATSKPRYAG